MPLDYLHYGETEYCSHQICEMRGGLGVMAWATRLLTKMSRQIAKSRGEYYGASENYSTELDCPKSVIQALNDMGAVHIEYSRGGAGMSEAVKVGEGFSSRMDRIAS